MSPTASSSGSPEVITPSLLRDWALPATGSSKYGKGQVLVVGGARNTPGAAMLAGQAALRVGAGRLVLARVGTIPPADEADRLAAFTTALTELGRRADHRGVRFALEVGSEPGSTVATFLETLAIPTLAASLDPAGLLAQGIDPAVAIRELHAHLAHVYATDASGTLRTSIGRGAGFQAGAIDWEELLGSLEEINYRGPLTVWPEVGQDPATRFAQVVERLRQF